MNILVTILSNSAVIIPLVIGLSLVYRISEIILFGAAHIAIFCAMIYASSGLPLAILVPMVLAVGAGLSVLTYVTILPAERRGVPASGLSLATLGMGLVLEYVGASYVGRHSFSADPWLTGSVKFAGTSMSYHRIAAIAAAALLLLIVVVLIDRTLVGRTMEATAFDDNLAQLYGIRTQRFRVLTWSVAGVSLALAGVLQVTFASVSQPIALPMLVIAFASAVVGGLGGILTGVAGVLVLSTAQTFFTQYVSSQFQTSLVFALLFIVLVFRPGGLFSNSRAVRRV